MTASLFIAVIMIPSALMIAGIGYFLYTKISQKIGSTRSSKVAAVSDPRLVALRSDGYHPDLGLTASGRFSPKTDVVET